MLRLWPLRRSELPLKSVEEHTYAHFVLVLQYVAPKGMMLQLLQWLFPSYGFYLIRAHVMYRSNMSLQVIRKHKLDQAGLFLDKVTADKARMYEKKVEDQAEKMRHAGEAFVLPLVILGQSIMLGWYEGQVVRLNVSSLTSGVNIAGTLDELQEVAGTLIGAVDHLSKKVEIALRFEQEETHVLAPGERPKPKKVAPGTPPSGWAT